METAECQKKAKKQNKKGCSKLGRLALEKRDRKRQIILVKFIFGAKSN